MMNMDWCRVENGWHVSGNRRYHALRYVTPEGQTRWKLTTSTRNNPRSLADEPTLSAIKAKAEEHAESLRVMPVGGWKKSQ